MNNLALRVATALVALPVVGALALWENRLGFAALVFLVIGLALSEYAQITLRGGSRAERVAAVATGLGFSVALYLRPELGALWTLAVVVVVATVVLLHPGDIATAGPRLGAAGFGAFYVGGLLTALALLQRDVRHGPFWVFVAVGVTFANDSGGYFAGRAFGRHKLYPLVSPAKTIEGGIGGLVFGLAYLFAARATFFPALTVGDCLAVGLPAAVLGPVGDLAESLIKRSAGVKDSGHSIPGHGGMLDRIDALLFVGAWVYAYASQLR